MSLEKRFYSIEVTTNLLTNKIQFVCQGKLENNKDLFKSYKEKFEQSISSGTIYWDLVEENLRIVLVEKVI